MFPESVMDPESFPQNVFQACNHIEAVHGRFENADGIERWHALTELLATGLQMESWLLAMAARPDIDIDLTGFVRWRGVLRRAHRLAAGSGELDPHADDLWPDARAALQRLRYKAGAVARGEVKTLTTADAGEGETDGKDEGGALTAAQLSLDARAVAVISDHKHFTKLKQVAEFLDVTHQALTRKKCPIFRAAFDALNQSPPPPHGYRADGEVEASSEERRPPRRRSNRLPE